MDDHAGDESHTHPWWKVIWLTGVDYFSTLGYQPGIALLAAGAVAPIATVILVLVTLLGALPVYAQVAGRSYAGQGSIAMLENLLEGWKGKVLVLVLLGFAATDFVITMTLSAADAAKHAIENPFLQTVLGEHQVLVTLAILAVLAVVFLKGFNEAIGLAAAAALPYLALNLVVLGRGAWEVMTHPALLADWRSALAAKGDFSLLIAGALLVFPKLALGLSGFETGVSVMPLIDGGERDRGHNPRPGGAPEGRVANTRKLLLTAAAIMSVHADPVELRHDAAHRTGRLPGGRQGQRARHRFPGPQVPRPRLRHGLRPLDDSHPRPRRRVGDGGAAPPDSPLPAALRHGPALGRALPAAGARAVRRRRRHHAGLRRGRGGAERRLRHGRAGADPVRRLRGHARAVARAPCVAGALHAASSAWCLPTPWPTTAWSGRTA